MRSTMVSAAVVRLLWGRTPGNKAKQSTYIICDGAASLKLEKNNYYYKFDYYCTSR
jgi:hypothetical protein